MWTTIVSWLSKNAWSYASTYLLKYWKIALGALAALVLALLVWAWQDAEGDYEEAVNANSNLQNQLSLAESTIQAERAANESARLAAFDWAREAADRAKDLSEALTKEEQANEAFAQCMSSKWSSSVVDSLPK